MNKCKLTFLIMIFLGTLLMGGCGNEEVVLVTTEKTSDSQEASDTDISTLNIEQSTTEYITTEAASEEEKSITLSQIYEANRGDKLLKDGVTGYGIKTIYYSAGTEIYSEYEYFGYDNDGMYMQVFEDSEGYVEILDIANRCWYIIEDGQVYTLIYPEDGMADVMINYIHNDMIISEPSDGEEIIKDVYRAEGNLIVETSGVTEYDEVYMYRYVLDESYRIMDISCFAGEELIYYSYTTENSVYNEPELITQIRTDSEKRMITVCFPDGSGIEYIYMVPRQYPIAIELYNSTAYKDSDYVNEWLEISPTSDGLYADESIYIKNNNN